MQVGQYCGYLTGTDGFVSGDFAIITFHSDYLSNKEKKGFHIRFTKIPGEYKYKSSLTSTGQCHDIKQQCFEVSPLQKAEQGQFKQNAHAH